MVDVDSFYRLYRLLASEPKRIKIFEGNHADNRPVEVEREAIQFVISVFKQSRSRTNNPRASPVQRGPDSKHELIRPPPSSSRKRSVSQNGNLRTPIRSMQTVKESPRFELDLRKPVPQKSQSPSKIKSISANKRSKNRIFDSDDEDRLGLPGQKLESGVSMNGHLFFRPRAGLASQNDVRARLYSKQELSTGNTTFIRNRSRSRANVSVEVDRAKEVPEEPRQKNFGEDFFADASLPNSTILGNRIKNQKFEWKPSKPGQVELDEANTPNSAKRSKQNVSLFVETRDHRIHQKASNLMKLKSDQKNRIIAPSKARNVSPSSECFLSEDPLKKSIGKAMDAKEVEHVINGFDFGKHDVTNITIDASSLKEMLRNRLHNNSLNLTNVSQIKHFLDKPHVPGFSKLGQVNLNVRPSAIGKKTLIRKTNFENKRGDDTSSEPVQRNLVRRGQVQGKMVPSRPKPVVFRTEVATNVDAPRKEFVNFQRLEEAPLSEASLESADFDSFDLEKEIRRDRNKIESVAKAKVFNMQNRKPDLHRVNQAKGPLQPNPNSGRSSGFQPYLRILKPESSIEKGFRRSQRNLEGVDEHSKSRPKVGSLQVALAENSRRQRQTRQRTPDAPKQTSLESSEDKYEKVNIYKDSIYQESINKYIQQSQLKLSPTNTIKSTPEVGGFKPMKPDTNEDFIGERARAS